MLLLNVPTAVPFKRNVMVVLATIPFVGFKPNGVVLLNQVVPPFADSS